jgi:hypothetical protein
VLKHTRRNGSPKGCCRRDWLKAIPEGCMGVMMAEYRNTFVQPRQKAGILTGSTGIILDRLNLWMAF